MVKIHELEYIIQEIENLSIEECFEYFEAFFTSSRYEEMNLDLEENLNFQKANAILFLEEGDLLERLEDALKEEILHPYAFLAYSYLADPAYVVRAYDEILKKGLKLDTLEDDQKELVYFFLDLYAEYLVQVRNLTKALKVQKVIEARYGEEFNYILRQGIIYAFLEKADEFYIYYQEVEFKDPILYIMLTMVLLKHEREEEARIVLNDLIANYPYFEYIDHPWDLELDESEGAQQFFHVLETCIADLEAIADFFLWCSYNKEEVFKS